MSMQLTEDGTFFTLTADAVRIMAGAILIVWNNIRGDRLPGVLNRGPSHPSRWKQS